MNWATLPLILVAFLIPYTIGWEWAWWKFVPSSIAIILLMRSLHPQSWLSDLGLRIRIGDIMIGFALLAILWPMASHIIASLLNARGYFPGPGSQHIGWKYLSVFQALNEEMLIRALLLTNLSKYFHSRGLISALSALVFALLHYALYRFGKLNTVLETQTLLTLFFFALACNTFFFATRNIAIPYAIHIAWNIPRFGDDWTQKLLGIRLQEAVGFNLVEGSSAVLFLGVILSVVAAAMHCTELIPKALRKCRALKQ